MVKLVEEGMCLGSENSRGLNHNWYEVVCSSQLNLLRCFSPFRVVCHSTCFSGGQLQMRWGESVGAGSIPDKDSSTFPRHHCCPVRPFPVCTTDPRWFQVGRNLGCHQGPLNEVIDRHVTGMAA